VLERRTGAILGGKETRNWERAKRGADVCEKTELQLADQKSLIGSGDYVFSPGDWSAAVPPCHWLDDLSERFIRPILFVSVADAMHGTPHLAIPCGRATAGNPVSRKSIVDWSGQRGGNMLPGPTA
jgi:hypothetical protein